MLTPDKRAALAEAIVDAIASDANAGFCVKCGQESDENCEPNALKCLCWACGTLSVYGAEELVSMGYCHSLAEVVGA